MKKVRIPKNRSFTTYHRVCYEKGGVELTYSWFMGFGFSKQKWFCRVWGKYGFIRGESYGRTKFEAYRKAMSNAKI